MCKLAALQQSVVDQYLPCQASAHSNECGCGVFQSLFFAQQLATRSVDEMHPRTGWASQGLVGTARFIWGNFFCQPMLDV
jgi:hypothetical protein